MSTGTDPRQDPRLHQHSRRKEPLFAYVHVSGTRLLTDGRSANCAVMCVIARGPKRWLWDAGGGGGVL